jgi:hypothetical protein
MGAVAGIDWASQTHVCCVIDDSDGRMLERFDVAHDVASLRAMTKRLVRAAVSRVAIERGDGPVVEVLMDAGIAVFVVPSRQVKGLRRPPRPLQHPRSGRRCDPAHDPSSLHPRALSPRLRRQHRRRPQVERPRLHVEAR